MQAADELRESTRREERRQMKAASLLAARNAMHEINSARLLARRNAARCRVGRVGR